jgi:hypothetical protein
VADEGPPATGENHIKPSPRRSKSNVLVTKNCEGQNKTVLLGAELHDGDLNTANRIQKTKLQLNIRKGKGKGKGKFHPRTGDEGPEGE